MFLHDQHRLTALGEPGSHCLSKEWSWALPIRIGGLDQMVANLTSAGTSSGAATRTLAIPFSRALSTHSSTPVR
ncbi:MAG: hypothetical protein R2715_09690 [Ilumatobacteraceae bacterium]